MEGPVPTWLNKSFLESSIQHEKAESSLKVVNYSVQPAVPIGSNFTSNLYRVLVQYHAKSASPTLSSITLIVKEPIEVGLATKVDLFSTEPIMYRKLLPKMNEKLGKHLAPTSFNSPFKEFLVLQDLKVEGFSVCDKLKQLDYHHCEMAIKTLAMFHATSVACHHTDPEIVQEASKECMFDSRFEFWKIIQATSIEIFTDYLKTLDGMEMFLNIVSKRSNSIWESLVEICKPKTKGLNVLNHGDCWSSNIMFKYNESNKISDVKLIDFQFTRYASPVLDLIYFLLTSPNYEVRCNWLLELFKEYVSTLNQTLEELSCPERFTMEDLQSDLKKAMDFFIITAAFIVPFTKTEPEHAIDFGSLTIDAFKMGEHKEKFRKMTGSKEYYALIPIMYKQFQILFPELT